MKNKIIDTVLKCKAGRIGMHVAGCIKSHRYKWHYKGIQRELPFLPVI